MLISLKLCSDYAELLALLSSLSLLHTLQEVLQVVPCNLRFLSPNLQVAVYAFSKFLQQLQGSFSEDFCRWCIAAGESTGRVLQGTARYCKVLQGEEVQKN